MEDEDWSWLEDVDNNQRQEEEEARKAAHGIPFANNAILLLAMH